MKTFWTLLVSFLAFANIAFAQTNIAAARTYAQGQALTVTGIVINGGALGPIRYLQDATAGIAVYDPNVTNTWNEGDEVTVSGTMGIFNGLIQIVTTTASTVNSTNNALPQPQVLAPSQVGAANEAQLVQINNATFSNAGGTFANGTLSVTAGGQTTQIFLRAGHPLVGSTIPLAPVNLVGVSSQFNGTPQILPRGSADVSIAAPFYLTAQPQQDNISQTGFSLEWTTNVAGTTKVIYGTSPTALNQTLDLGGSTTTHTANLTGLSPATIYYAQAVSQSGNNTATSVIEPFATVSTSSGQIDIHFNGVVDNSISTGVDANHAIPAHLEEKIITKINEATTSIDVAIYNINRDPIVQALNAAVGRGVVVRLVSNTGSANLALQNVPPLFSVLSGNASALMHNKFVVIDRDDAAKTWVITGSMNFTQQNILDDFNNVLFIQDQTLAKAYTLEFEEMWGGSNPTPGIFAAKFGALKTKNTPRKFVIDNIPMELYFSPTDGTTAAISAALQSADTKIEFAVLSFTRDDLRTDIINAHNAGATVRGMIENTNDQGGEYATLAAAGIAMKDHPEAGQIHHKYAIIDETNTASDPIVVTGSHNWSASAETSNDENTLIIHDATIANIFAQEFNARWLGLTTGVPTRRALEGFSVNLFPNPATDFVQLDLNSEIADEISVSIIDQSGKTLQTQSFSGIKGQTMQRLEVSNWAAGTYFVTFKVGDLMTFKQFLKL